MLPSVLLLQKNMLNKNWAPFVYNRYLFLKNNQMYIIQKSPYVYNQNNNTDYEQAGQSFNNSSDDEDVPF